MAEPARIKTTLEARPSIGGSVLTVRLGDLREVVLAGSNVPPLMSRHTDPLIGPVRSQIADTHLFLHTFARAWGLESVEPLHGGVRIQILLLPAPEPPVVQAAVGRAVIELHDGQALAQAWIDPLEPSLEVLFTRDHKSARSLSRPAQEPRRARPRKPMLKAPRVLTADSDSVPLWRRKDVWIALAAFGLGAAGIAAFQGKARAQDHAQAWTRMVAAADVPEGTAPTVRATAARTFGGLSARAAAAALTGLELEGGRCFLDTLPLVHDPASLAGDFQARITFRGGGRVMAVDTPQATFDDPELSGCLTQAARRLTVTQAPAGSGMDLVLALGL